MVLAICVLLNGRAFGISNLVPKLEVQVKTIRQKTKWITEIIFSWCYAIGLISVTIIELWLSPIPWHGDEAKLHYSNRKDLYKHEKHLPSSTIAEYFHKGHLFFWPLVWYLHSFFLRSREYRHLNFIDKAFGKPKYTLHFQHHWGKNQERCKSISRSSPLIISQ